MARTIIYLHPHFTAYGGAGRFVLESGRRLAQRGYRVRVISIRADQALVGDYRQEIDFIDIGGPLSSSLWFWILFPWSCIKISRVLNKFDDFILFSQVFPANWWGGFYKLFHKKIRLVWMCQEPSAFIHSREWIASIKDPLMRLGARLFNPLLKAIDGRFAALPDRVIANSEYTRRYAQEVYGYADDMIKTVYIGVEAPGAVEVKIFDGGAFTMITVGRLTKFKNIGTVIRALKIMLDQGHQVRLNIVGDGEERGALERLAGQLGLETLVSFSGSVSRPQLDRLYDGSHLYVSAALNEPFGLAPLEAMAHGLPVVAVNSGGPAETVIDQSSGFLIPGNDAGSLASAVVKLIQDPSLYKQAMSRSGKRAEYFNWTSTMDGLVDVFSGYDG
ncbi:MAG: glycosyltransferase family 4 protein [Candidatus Edwardsbacteria bacterium]|nr:glycosyltransferase family 4 protein [Candidatus Edwardsbacteria bacterium]